MRRECQGMVFGEDFRFGSNRCTDPDRAGSAIGEALHCNELFMIAYPRKSP
jgi:hypothetical protein